MYVVLIRYLKPIEEVDKHVKAHRAFLDKYYTSGMLVASGPQVPRSGGILLTRPLPRQRLEEILKEDPYQKEGIAEYTILEFQPVKSAPGFEPFLKTVDA